MTPDCGRGDDRVGVKCAEGLPASAPRCTNSLHPLHCGLNTRSAEKFFLNLTTVRFYCVVRCFLIGGRLKHFVLEVHVCC